MKRAQFKVKVTRTVISFMICLFVVFSSTISPKADTIQAHGTVSTSYGSYTWSAQQAASTLPINITLPYVGISFAYNSGTSFSIDYSLKNQYSGIVTITVTGNNKWSVDTVNIITSGCTLDSIPSDHASYEKSHTFTLRLKQSQNFSFVIYGAGTTIFLGSTTVSVAHNMSVDNKIDQIDSTLDLYLPGMSDALSHLGYDGNPDNSLSADTLAYDIAVIKNYIDGIEGSLAGSNTYLGQIKLAVDGLETLLEELKVVSMYNIEPYQHSAWIWSSKQDSSFPRWKYGLPYMQFSSSGNNASYDASHGIRLANGYSYAMIFYSSKALSTSNVSIYYSAATGSVQVSTLPITEINSQLYLTAFIFKNINNGFTSFEPEFNQDFELYPLYFGLTNNIPDEVNLILGREYDNTYTRLLQSIANGIGNITQEQINENITNINNYNDYQTSINNVENRYYNNYNTYNTELVNNNTFDFNDIPGNGAYEYKNLFTQAFNISLVKWPTMIILLGLVVVIILG